MQGLAVEPRGMFTVSSAPFGSTVDVVPNLQNTAQLLKLEQAPTLPPAAPAPLPAVAATAVPAGAVPATAVPAPVTIAPAAAVAPLAAAVTAAPAALLTTALPPAALTQAPAAVAPVAATTGNKTGNSTAGNKSSNSTAPVPGAADSPPYLHGPVKILVYGFFFGLFYLGVWFARQPAEKRPAAIDEGLMRWIESQEEEDPTGGMNCMLVRIKGASGLTAEQLPAAISVECSSFGQKALCIGETDCESDGVWDTCFVGPLLDQTQNRNVTMEAAKPEVKFIVKKQGEDGAKAVEFAQAVMKPGSSSSSSAASGEGGITRGEWCSAELKLASSSSGMMMGGMKRMVAGSVGTLSVEVKVMQVNPAGKALLKSNYYVIALRNEFKKPYSACARTLAVALIGMLFLTSVPLIGDMFNGCFYLSCHGLTACCTLFAISGPHWAKLLHIQLPSFITWAVDKMDLDSMRTAGIALSASGWSGVSICFWWGHGMDCTNHFWMLEILLVFDAFLFTTAWWKGEGGGLMGWAMGA